MAETLFIIFIVAFAIVLHEYAHGWVAYRLGDSTAKLAGRLSLNPLKHIDPFGSIILPASLIVLRNMGAPVLPFGWAKPIPVNFFQLRHPKRDMIWVAIAGPTVNILMALAFSLLLKYKLNLNMEPEIFALGVYINILLAVFNMIPIPPLDGSRIVMGLLPKALAIPYSRLEPYGILIVFALLTLGVFDKIILPVVIYLSQLLGVQ